MDNTIKYNQEVFVYNHRRQIIGYANESLNPVNVLISDSFDRESEIFQIADKRYFELAILVRSFIIF